jgi:hypothetical protein
MAAMSEATPTPQSPHCPPSGLARMSHAGAHETVNYPANLLEANAERFLMSHPRCRDGSGARRTPAPIGTALIFCPPGPPRRGQQLHPPLGHQPGDRAVTSTMRAPRNFRNFPIPPDKAGASGEALCARPHAHVAHALRRKPPQSSAAATVPPIRV